MDLYFIALIIPPPPGIRIVSLKNSIAEKFNCHHALKTPPHITLEPPFKTTIPPAVLFRLMAPFRNYLPIHISLSGFGFFDRRVAFIRVKPSPDLTGLHHQIGTVLRSNKIIAKPPAPFHPHVTLAHRDLADEQFDPLKLFLGSLSFEEEVRIDRISLLQHTGGKWNVLKEEH